MYSMLRRGLIDRMPNGKKFVLEGVWKPLKTLFLERVDFCLWAMCGCPL